MTVKLKKLPETNIIDIKAGNWVNSELIVQGCLNFFCMVMVNSQLCHLLLGIITRRMLHGESISVGVADATLWWPSLVSHGFSHTVVIQ